MIWVIGQFNDNYAKLSLLLCPLLNIVALNETERYTLVSVSVCAYLSLERGTEGFDAEVSHGKKKRNLTRPLSPLLFTTAAFDYWVAVFQEKKVCSYISLLKILLFHQPTLTRAKDLTVNVSEAVAFRGQEQCEDGGCPMGNKLNFLFLFPSNLMRNMNYSVYACLTLISRMLLLPLGVTVGFWNSSNLGSSTYSRS